MSSNSELLTVAVAVAAALECLGGEVSDRQWRDILGVIAVQGDRLDRAFLQTTANATGLNMLLARAFSEADASTNEAG